MYATAIGEQAAIGWVRIGNLGSMKESFQLVPLQEHAARQFLGG